MSVVKFINKTGAISDLNRFNTEAKILVAKVMVVLKFGVDDLKFNISDDLTPAEEALIDGLLVSFVDTDPGDKVPYIYELSKSGSGKHFHEIDYKTELKQSLIPKRTTNKGEVVKVEWFESLDESNVPINPVVRVDIVYTRDATGFALYRTTSRTWINIDGSDNEEVKLTKKYYFVNSVDQIQEGIKRRKLLVDNIQIPVLGLVMQALMPLGYTQTACLLKGRAFMDDYETVFSKFVTNSSTLTDAADPDFGMKTVRRDLRDEDNPDHIVWLDKSPGSLGGVTTIRQYLMEEFDI